MGLGVAGPGGRWTERARGVAQGGIRVGRVHDEVPVGLCGEELEASADYGVVLESLDVWTNKGYIWERKPVMTTSSEFEIGTVTARESAAQAFRL